MALIDTENGLISLMSKLRFSKKEENTEDVIKDALLILGDLLEKFGESLNNHLVVIKVNGQKLNVFIISYTNHTKTFHLCQEFSIGVLKLKKFYDPWSFLFSSLSSCYCCSNYINRNIRRIEFASSFQYPL